MTDIEKVYEEYFTTVYKYLMSLSRSETIADELTQETFFKALKSLDQFKGDCKLSVWLCQIAKNSYFSYLEKEKKKGDLPNDIIDDFSLEKEYVHRETALQVHKILHTMDEPYKEVFSLRTFGELSFREIGDLFGKTESWARVTYHRAKIKIREEIV